MNNSLIKSEFLFSHTGLTEKEQNIVAEARAEEQRIIEAGRLKEKLLIEMADKMENRLKGGPSLIKTGFRKRTKVYGILASLLCLSCAVIFSSLIVGAVGVLSLAIHVVSKH